MTIIPILTTERLLLRGHRLDDFDEFLALWKHKDLVRFIGGELPTREQVWARLLRYGGLWHHLGFGFFAVQERESGKLIGEVGFLDLHRDEISSTEGTLEAGWGITPPMQGKGYATEAMSAAIAWADKQFAGRRMTCMVDLENKPSLRIAEKIGFRRIGEVNYKHKPNAMFERQANRKMVLMSEMFSIKTYEPSDAHATIDIFLRAIRQAASRHYSPEQITAWAKIDDAEVWAQYRASRPTWLAMKGPAPVGFADLKPDGCLDMMFVDPDYRGKGVASLLLATVERAARDQGLPRIFTEASLTARPFFERRGFVVLAAQEVQKRGQTLANFRMEKML